MFHYLKYYLLFLVIFFCNPIFSQNSGTNSGGQVLQIQPSVVVVPWVATKSNISITDLLEGQNGFQLRAAISAVNEAFNTRGFTVNDFFGLLNNSEKDLATNRSDATAQKQTVNDQITALAKNSMSDIIVETDITYYQNATSGNEIKLILRAKDAYTAKALADKFSVSGKYHTDDIVALTRKALGKTDPNTETTMMEDFLSVLQSKFTDIVNNGRSFRYDFRIAEGSEITFDKEVNSNGDLLLDAISDWMAANAYKNYAKMKSQTTYEVEYSDVRLPLRDQSTKMNYRVDQFNKLLRNYFRTTYNINLKFETPEDGTVYVYIK